MNFLNEKAKSILKNLNYTVSANFLVLGISIILNLFVPRYLGIKEYSYWQLYVFYTGYVGFFHFGWLDGIYLKIGGEEYEELDKKSLGTQFWYLVFFQLILAVSLLLYTVFFTVSGSRTIIFISTALVLIITNCKTFILYIFQSTNRIKEYAQLSRNDRYLYIIGVFIYLYMGGRSFSTLIILDVVAKLVLTIWGMYKIVDIIFVKFINSRVIFSEIISNLKIGINLMVGNIASMLVMGITRLFVEQHWDIEVFGKLSFTLSLSNMFMTFINAIGVVMFPLLRRTDRGNLKRLYINLRNIFVPFTFAILLSYIPMKYLLNIWLPSYSQSMVFMGVLFPMVVYEGRMALLISTYLKTLRQEKVILIVNIATLLLSVLLSYFFVFILNNIYITVIGIIICIAFRSIFAEIFLTKKLDIDLRFDIFLETLLTFSFIGLNLLSNSIISFCLYLLMYLLFIFIKRKSIWNSYVQIASLIKK